MQIADGPSDLNHDADHVTVLGPSLALELSWACHSAWSPRIQAQHAVLGRLATEHPAVLDSFRSFWPDGADCFPEFQVLAHTAGALEATDFDELFAALDRARHHVPDRLALRSETDADRRAIISRLAQLRDDEERWAAYVEVFAGLYPLLDEWWRTTGLPGVRQAVVTTRRELAEGADWTRMVSSDCATLLEHFPGIVERREPVLLALCALFGKGLYLDLPGTELIGIGAGLGEYGARARTAELAARIRVLADPTRLAILDHLRSAPRSVGDIAVDFALAQPTVSAHVKQLRQAGLVTATRRGNRLELTVNSDALGVLAGDLSALVGA